MKTLLVILLTSIAYIVSAYGGLTIGTLGTNATLLWPASGVALCAIRHWGFKAGWGIWLGSFAINLIFYNRLADNFSTPETFYAVLVCAFVIALGNTIEPMGLRFVNIYRLTVLGKKTANQYYDIEYIKWVFIIAGFSFFAAWNGTMIQVALDLQPSKNIFPMILTWWVGDFLGMVLVPAPLNMLICRLRGIPYFFMWK